MKPNIIHLIGDELVGGSNLYVKSLMASRLKDTYNFHVCRLEELTSVLKTISPQKPEVIVFHYASNWQTILTLIKLKLKLRSKIVLVEHHYCEGFEQNQVPSLFRFRWMLKLNYRIVDCVLGVARGQKQWMIKQQLVAENNLRVIPLSTSGSTKLEDLLSISPKPPGKPFVLGAYGRFARQKGFDLLLKAMAHLPAEEFCLRLGGYGFDAEELAELAEDLPQVNMVGAVKDVPGFLAQCDAVIVPSRWEPGGTVCLEIKAAAKPLIATDIDCFPEHVEGCGLLFPPDDCEQLAATITSLKEQDLSTWGQIARASVANSWEPFLDSWDMLLKELL